MRVLELVRAFEGETQVIIRRPLDGIEKAYIEEMEKIRITCKSKADIFYEGKINDIPLKLFDELGYYVLKATIDKNVLNILTTDDNLECSICY